MRVIGHGIVTYRKSATVLHFFINYFQKARAPDAID